MTKTVKILILSVISFVLSGIIILSGISLYPIYNSAKDLLKYERIDKWVGVKDTHIVDEYEIKLCNFDLLNPEYLYIYKSHYDSNPGYISYSYAYYILTRPSLFSQNWTIDKYIGYNGGGSTGVVNNFDELKDMVKKDCNQFKTAPNFNKPKTKEQQIAEEKEEETKLEYQRYRLHGYTQKEYQDWWKNTFTEEERNRVTDEIIEKWGIQTESNMVKIFIMYYNLPAKDGYPITDTTIPDNRDKVVRYYGYREDEVNRWWKENLIDTQKFTLEQLAESLKDTDGDMNKITKILIKEYGLPQKPGYPVD